MTSKSHRPVPTPGVTAGNTLLVVLMTIAVLSLVGGNMMWSASSRYHVTYQSASWQEALVAAEAGVDLAMAELKKYAADPSKAPFSNPDNDANFRWRQANAQAGYDGNGPDVRAWLGGAVDPTRLPDDRRTVVPDLRTTFPDNGHALPMTPLPGSTTLAYRVYVDSPGSDDVVSKRAPTPPLDAAFKRLASSASALDPGLQFIGLADRSPGNQNAGNRPDPSMPNWWWRIRAVGYAGVSKPPRPSPDKRDNGLRRFSFFTDWRNGGPAQMPTGPGGTLEDAAQVSRVVEVLARPRPRFYRALFANRAIDLSDQAVRVDSYKSMKTDAAGNVVGYYPYNAVVLPPTSADSRRGYTAPGGSLDSNGNVNLGALRNVGWEGNVGTNDQILRAGRAHVLGDIATNHVTLSVSLVGG